MSLFLTNSLSSTENYYPNNFYFLGSHDNVFLFRGGFPEIDALEKSIKAILPLQENFQFIDISFLNPLQEQKNISLEKHWFYTHSKRGFFYSYPLYGALINPIDLPKTARDFIAHCFDIDGLKTLMSQLKTLIYTPSSIDLIIYIHCAAGKDRTGEAAACYLMQYQKHSYTQAIELNESIAGRALEPACMNAIRWYAFYLRDAKKMDWIGDIEGN